ncbi:uncharacterized protein LOC122369604 [Amphibalanus amphitrite]|uniref:uncharacterized protein LOC122369604 n=1 Tax=Amphibalanus amphitrite TaxID=1232801 RepID=UPI001C91F5B7|nr:uncharacterized protein LOC122369604 [Amphibalanus amphitrite]
MTGGRRSPLLVAAALLLVLTPTAEPYGYGRLAELARRRFSGGLVSGQRLSSGLGRHVAAVADSLRAGADRSDSDVDDLRSKLDKELEPALDPPPRRRLELKRFLRRQHHHHKKMMAKNKRLSNKNEICLFKALRRCGNHLITELSSDMTFDHRCSSKEDFLDCMSRMQHGRCHVKHARHGPSRALVQQYQQRLRRLLKATRGCVIGIDLSTETD